MEVFALADLGELGLVGYLREGVDVPEADLQADRQKLSGLDGWVMLVHSSAFGGQGVVLTPWSEITLIGTYAQQQADQQHKCQLGGPIQTHKKKNHTQKSTMPR